MRQQTAIWILLACGGALGVIALMRPDLLAGGMGVRLLYFALLLAFVGSAAVTHFRASPGGAARNVLIWLVVVVAIAAVYRLWQTWTAGA